MKSCAHRPDIRFFMSSKVSVQLVKRCHLFDSVSSSFRPSIPRNPTVRSVRHMAAETLTYAWPSRQNCIVPRSTHVSSKPRLCAANENNVTRRPGKPFYGRPREDLQFLSRGPLVASIRDDACGSRNLFLCLRSWFPQICAMLSSWVEQKNLKEIGKFLNKIEREENLWTTNYIYL